MPPSLPCTRKVATAACLIGMKTSEDYLELAVQCEIEAAKVRDKVSCRQLLALAKSYRTLAESTVLLEQTAKAVETVDMRPRAKRGT